MAELYRLNEDVCAPCLEGTSCAFGVFDGVHLGHRFIIDEMKSDAQAMSSPSAILTFDHDPDELFSKSGFKKLMDNDRRIRALCDTGVDIVAILPFNKRVAALEAKHFLDRCFAPTLPRSVHVGIDFHFGAQAKGTCSDLDKFGERAGMSVCAYDLLKIGDIPVSSTYIRSQLAEGNIERANEFLGHPYQIEGIVVKGRGQGSHLGFATANLCLDDELRALKDGVYAGYCLVCDRQYSAAVSVGVSPTFSDAASANIEVHILDFEGNLLDCTLVVSLCHRLRDMVKFSSQDELIKAVNADINWVRLNL